MMTTMHIATCLETTQNTHNIPVIATNHIHTCLETTPYTQSASDHIHTRLETTQNAQCGCDDKDSHRHLTLKQHKTHSVLPITSTGIVTGHETLQKHTLYLS